MGGRVLVGQGLPEALARIVVLDVVPVDLDRRGLTSLRRRSGRSRGARVDGASEAPPPVHAGHHAAPRFAGPPRGPGVGTADTISAIPRRTAGACWHGSTPSSVNTVLTTGRLAVACLLRSESFAKRRRRLSGSTISARRETRQGPFRPLNRVNARRDSPPVRSCARRADALPKVSHMSRVPTTLRPCVAADRNPLVERPSRTSPRRPASRSRLSRRSSMAGRMLRPRPGGELRRPSASTAIGDAARPTRRPDPRADLP